MPHLTNKNCVPCRAGASLVSREDISQYMSQLAGWRLLKVEGIERLEKTYQFKNFAQALEFTNQIGAIAEQENHHPALLTEWGRVTVTWWTHKVAGLHDNDFIMAAKTDEVWSRGNRET